MRTLPRPYRLDPDAPWVGVIRSLRKTGTAGASTYRLLCRVTGPQGGWANACQADHLAIAAGYHPCELWPEWFAPGEPQGALVGAGRA